MRELSDEARAVLRDFILVFDLEGFFKGSTEITEAGQLAKDSVDASVVAAV
jgi:hypothetical protein